MERPIDNEGIPEAQRTFAFRATVLLFLLYSFLLRYIPEKTMIEKVNPTSRV